MRGEKKKKGDIWLVYSVASVMICVKSIWPAQSGLFPSANSISPEACQSWGLCLLLQASGSHFEPPVSDYCKHGMKGEHHRSGTPSTSTWDCFCDIWHLFLTQFWKKTTDGSYLYDVITSTPASVLSVFGEPSEGCRLLQTKFRWWLNCTKLFRGYFSCTIESL